MKMNKRILSVLLVGTVLLAGCSSRGEGQEDSGSASQSSSESVSQSSGQEGSEGPGTEAAGDAGEETPMEKIDMAKWQYEEEADVYWQVGISYCANPADETYETLGIYVPGAYMNGTENGDGTYTCEVDPSGSAGGYTAETAPIVLPVDTPGYAAMAAPTAYVSSTASYTDAGFVYVYAGCRGRDAGAPAGVTDLKAAIRYIRWQEETLPGSTERIFSFGMSGGGAQSALLGATGDSELYTPYLEAIGAVSGVSDAVAGSMCWCPITNLDYASEAYEWNLGVTRTDLTEEMQELSDGMAEKFAEYINELGLRDENGETLLLTASEEGIYQAGSYYDYLKTVIETSLNNFLADTTFPYTVANGGRGGGFGGGRMDGEGFDGEKADLPERGGKAELGENGEGFGVPGGKGDLGENGEDFGGPGGGGDLDENGEGFGTPDGKEIRDLDGEEKDYYQRDGIDRNETAGGVSLSGTYETAQDYIQALNAETEWVAYDSETNTAAITSIADFVSACKTASKDLGAFDALDESQGENTLFGDGDGQGDHFDAAMAELLKDSSYYEAFAEDLQRTDALGVSVEDRVNMYTPLYYLSDYYEGYGTAKVASHWRIRTGINQSDTALTTEVNLALALENYGVDVDFETVWGQAHVEAERTGDSVSNFIEWVAACCQ